MSTTKNIAANFASRLWGVISLYLFTNIYIRLIGIESYGMISIYTLIFGVVSFIDVGLSSAINREFAKDILPPIKLRVLFYLEKIYIIICLMAVVAIFFSAPFLAKNWLTPNNIPIATVILQIRLIIVGVGLQLVPTIYFGALMGLQKQVWCNSAQIVWSFFKTAGGAAVLYFIAPSLVYYFWWQIICNVIYLLTLRRKVIIGFGSFIRMQIINNEVLPAGLWKYISGMAGIAVLSAISIQSDKIIISKIFSLADFGYYSLASLIAQIPLLIATPIILALFPKLIRTFSSAQPEGGENMISKYAILIGCIIFPVCVVICFFNQTLFAIWVSIKGTSIYEFSKLKYVMIFLTTGNAFLALQLLPFYLLLAKGKTRYTIYQGIAQVCFILPGLYFFSRKYGLNGIGIPWMIVNFGGFIYLMFIIQKYLGCKTIWVMIISSIKIGFISFIITCLVYFLTRTISENYYQLMFAFLAGIISIVVSLVLSIKRPFVTIKQMITR